MEKEEKLPIKRLKSSISRPSEKVKSESSSSKNFLSLDSEPASALNLGH